MWNTASVPNWHKNSKLQTKWKDNFIHSNIQWVLITDLATDWNEINQCSVDGNLPNNPLSSTALVLLPQKEGMHIHTHTQRIAHLQRWLIISGFKIWMLMEKRKWHQEPKCIHVTQFRFYCQATCSWTQKYLIAHASALSNTLKSISFL